MRPRSQRPCGLLAIGGWLMLLGAACSFPSVMVADAPPEEGPECVAPSDCPEPPNPCLEASCDEVEGCGSTPAEAGTPCGGGVCLDGSCGDCADNSDCQAGIETCSDEGRCEPDHCRDTMLSGDETDLDCGGSCDPCGEGEACEINEDCGTLLCDDMTCVGCTQDTQCGNGQFCNLGLARCENQRVDGDICMRDEACDSGFCPSDDGICCASACDGRCESCFEPRHGVTGDNGVCHFLPDGTDPDGDCPVLNILPRTCNGEGMCRLF